MKSLGQDAKDLRDEIKDANDEIDIYEFVFIGSNNKKLSLTLLRYH